MFVKLRKELGVVSQVFELEGVLLIIQMLVDSQLE